MTGDERLETDYLVVGAGALGMAFVDSLVDHSDADVVMVERRHRPGGHWLDSYPFVQLHQPSRFYGVDSTPLGEDRSDARRRGRRLLRAGQRYGDLWLLRRDHASPVHRVGAGPVLPDVRLPGRAALPFPGDRAGDGGDRSPPGRRRHVHGLARPGDGTGAVRGGRRGALRPGRRAHRARAAGGGVRDRRRGQDRVGRHLLVARSRVRSGRHHVDPPPRLLDPQSGVLPARAASDLCRNRPPARGDGRVAVGGRGVRTPRSRGRDVPHRPNASCRR